MNSVADVRVHSMNRDLPPQGQWGIYEAAERGGQHARHVEAGWPLSAYRTGTFNACISQSAKTTYEGHLYPLLQTRPVYYKSTYA